jgi:hypothetical protein
MRSILKKILLAFCITAGFTACKNNPSGSPKATIDGMFTVMKNGDIDGMKKFITRADLSNFETLEKIGNNADSGMVKTIKDKITEKLREELKTVSYTLKNEKIDGDNATIEAEVTKEGKTAPHTFELVKEEDGWKIALSKPGNEMFNSMKGNMGPERGDMLKNLEKLKNMNPDSLKMLINKANQVMDSLKTKRIN